MSDVDAVRRPRAPGKTKVDLGGDALQPAARHPDIAALAEVAHEAGALLVVDNTFATPYLQQPLALGADVVVHSTTKYIGGHSDVVGGALIAADEASARSFAYHQNAMGAVAGPFDAWLTLRGIKTLGVRMDRHCANAQRIAEAARSAPKVPRSITRACHRPRAPGRARSRCAVSAGWSRSGVAGGEEEAVGVCGRTELFTLGESLGGVESLIEHPGRMTHASVAGSPLEVPGDLVRLSAGIEDLDDLVADLRQAL